MFCDARSVHFQKWISALIKRGYAIEVFSPWRGDNNSCKTHTIATPKTQLPIPNSLKTAGKILMRAYIGRRLRTTLLKKQPRLVHAHYLLDSGWIASQLDLHPFVVTVHGSDLLVKPRQSRQYSYIAKKVLQKADRVVIVNEHFRTALVKYGIPQSKIRVVPSFVDTSLFYPDQTREDSDRITIGSARNFEKIYDVETLIRAIPDIRKKKPNIQVLLAGRGSLRPQLETLCAQLAVSDIVQFVGVLDQETLACFLRRLDIYVSTAISDGLSVTLLESAACGAYPVLANIPGNRELGTLGLKATLFKAGCISNLSEAVAQAIEIIQKEEEVILRNAKAVHKHFAKGIIMNKMADVYNELTNFA